MMKYTSFYDRVFTCLHNSSLRLIRHYFIIPFVTNQENSAVFVIIEISIINALQYKRLNLHVL